MNHHQAILFLNFDEPHRVVFEILESDKVGNYQELKKFIQLIKKYGCKFALDDFGSGYSNFEKLLKRKKLKLSVKHILPNPWDTIDERYNIGKKIKGKITKVTKFGIFVEIEKGGIDTRDFKVSDLKLL